MKYLVLFPLCILHMNMQAQPGFNQSYDLGELAASFCSIERTNDTIIVYGGAKESGASGFGMLFARLDTFGNVIDYKIYNDSLGDEFTLVYPNSFMKRPNNSGYAGVGQVFYRVNGYLSLFDNQGNVVKYVEYKDSVSLTDFYKQVKELEDGFLIAGEKQNPVTYKTEIFVLKTDLQGNIIWEKKYPALNRAAYFSQIQIINSNEYLISSTTIKTYFSLSQQRNTSKIFAIDSLGNIKWQWESQPSLEEMGAGQIYKTVDNNWLYMSARGWYNSTYNEISVQPKVVIRDENFNLIKQDTFDIANSPVTFFSNSIQLSDGGWLAVGSKPVNYATPPIFSEFNAVAGWMVKIDDQANKVWSRIDTAFWSTQSGSTNYLYDAVELPGGSIIACGYSRTYEPAGKDWGWLVKISPDGCVDTLSCATLQAPVHLLPEALVSIYPNPATSWLHIESQDGILWDKIELLDMSGRVLQTLYTVAEHRLDVSGLAAGLYVLRLTKAQRSVTKKVVKRP